MFKWMISGHRTNKGKLNNNNTDNRRRKPQQQELQQNQNNDNSNKKKNNSKKIEDDEFNCKITKKLNVNKNCENQTQLTHSQQQLPQQNQTSQQHAKVTPVGIRRFYSNHNSYNHTSDKQYNSLNASRDTLDDSNEYTTLEQLQEPQQPPAWEVRPHPNYGSHRSLYQPLPPLPGRERGESPPLRTPSTCTLPRRALGREDPALRRLRSPSNPPPTYREPQIPAILPPPPPPLLSDSIYPPPRGPPPLPPTGEREGGYPGGADSLRVNDEPRGRDATPGGNISGISPWMEWTQQLQAYKAWVNSQLRKNPEIGLVTDLRRDFQNGVVFADLIHILSGEPVVGVIRSAETPQLRRENVERVLRYLATKGVRQTDVSAKEISEGGVKSVMRLILALAAHYKPHSLQQQPAPQNEEVQLPTRQQPKQEFSQTKQPQKTKIPQLQPIQIPQQPREQQIHIELRQVPEKRQQSAIVRTNEKIETHDVSVGPDQESCGIEAPVYENLPCSEEPTNASTNFVRSWACDSLRASHKFNYEDTGSTSSHQDYPSNKLNALDFWLDLTQRSKGEQIEDNDCPLRYHTIHRMSGRRRLPQIPGQSPIPSTPTSLSSRSPPRGSREPEGRSQNSSPVHQESMKEVHKGDGSVEPSSLRQEVLKHIIVRQALETERVDLSRQVREKETLIEDLRRQILIKEKTIHLQKTQLEEVVRNLHNGMPNRGLHQEGPASRCSQGREELQLVREAIFALRGNFRDADPNQHTLDTLEQAIAVLIERIGNVASNSFNQGGHSHATHTNHPSQSTKLIYFTNRTVTPFMTYVTGNIGEITLRTFKDVFDRPGRHRFYFRNQDMEYGPVKEEVIDDDVILPGVDGKIIAWVEEDSE